MTLANQESGVRGNDYREVLRQLGLEGEFESAWGAELSTSREMADIGSVSEHIIIEKTLEEAEQAFAFSYSVHQGIPTYHVIPVEEA